MRIKFLAIIAGFLFVSIALSSCLDSDNTVEYSSDATVYAFGLDTIYGKHYTFTIDQINRVIYNRDSLPVGSDTIIDRILIDTFTVAGWITAGVSDTLFIRTDSVDLLPAVNNESGMKFKVHAPDGRTYREYTLKVNKHTVDPDSLVWHNLSAFAPTLAGNQKSVILNNELWVYTETGTAYHTSTLPDKFGWNSTSVSTFPAGARLNTLVNFRKTNKSKSDYTQSLYVVTDNNEVYSSSNGETWTAETGLGNNIVNLIAGFPDKLTGITADGYSCISENGKTWLQNADGTPVLTTLDANFPKENVYYTTFTNVNNLSQVMLVSGTPNPQYPELTVPWFSMNGSEWTDMITTSYDAACPYLYNPVCMYYGDTFYLFGSEEDNKLDAIYSSVAGLTWKKTERKFLLPEEFKGIAAPYSITVDADNYIWVIFAGDGKETSVWRGRLNRLGFKIQ